MPGSNQKIGQALLNVFVRENNDGEFEVPTTRDLGVDIDCDTIYFTSDRQDAYDTAKSLPSRASAHSSMSCSSAAPIRSNQRDDPERHPSRPCHR